MESAVRKFFNKGGTFWLLGIKTRRPGDSTHTAAIIDTEFGGKTELLGGLIFIRPVTPLFQPIKPAFYNNSKLPWCMRSQRSIHVPLCDLIRMLISIYR